VTERAPTAMEYGARFAGFVYGFVVAYKGNIPTSDAAPVTVTSETAGKASVEQEMLLVRAATAAWEDALIRERRADKAREAPGP